MTTYHPDYDNPILDNHYVPDHLYLAMLATLVSKQWAEVERLADALFAWVSEDHMPPTGMTRAETVRSTIVVSQRAREQWFTGMSR